MTFGALQEIQRWHPNGCKALGSFRMPAEARTMERGYGYPISLAPPPILGGAESDVPFGGDEH